MTSHLIYPSTNLNAIEQLEIVGGEGIYVVDSNGKQYIEGLSGLWCTGLGYGNEELVETAARAMKQASFSHLFAGKFHRPAVELAEKLHELMPVNNASVFFGNSGSDGNDTLVKLINYYADATGQPQRRKIIARERSYHGITVAAASLTGLPANQKHFGLPVDALGILRTHAPHYYRGQQGSESEDQFVDRILADLEAQILSEGPETIAAFIAEPITGASGVIVAPESYYPKLTALLKKYGIWFWSDEVITGFGRTGNVFGCTTMGAPEPDLMTTAKQLTSAYFPLSAVAVRGDIHAAMLEQCGQVGIFGHGYTYSGHSTACAVGLKTLEIYQRDGIYQNAAERGVKLQAELAKFADHPMVGEVRGKGLIAAVEVVANKETRAEFAGGAGANRVLKHAQDNGLLLRNTGGSALAFCPPMIITDEQIDDIIDKFGDALDKSFAELTAEGLIDRDHAQEALPA